MKLPRTTSIIPPLAALSFTLFGAMSIAASPRPSTAATYTWGARLVSLDEAARTVTVSAHIIGFQPLMQLPKFKPGDQILLTWAVQTALNSPDSYGDAISETIRYDGRQKLEPFTLLAEFVSFDPANQSVAFKTAVTPDVIGRMKSLKVGESLVATSPILQPATSEFIVSVQHFSPSHSF